MSKIQSHANCEHVSTKAARAQCRRSRAKFADMLSTVAAEGVTTIETPAPVFEPVRVTAENWREFRETPVRIAVRLTDDEESEVATGVKISGWGKQWINYVNDEGKTKRTTISCTYAETVEA